MHYIDISIVKDHPCYVLYNLDPNVAYKEMIN